MVCVEFSCSMPLFAVILCHCTLSYTHTYIVLAFAMSSLKFCTSSDKDGRKKKKQSPALIQVSSYSLSSPRMWHVHENQCDSVCVCK